MLLIIFKSQSGMTALVTVIIISAAALIAVQGVARLGLSEVDMSFTRSQGEAALAIAEACAEETFRRWQLDNDYSANDKNITVGKGICTLSTSAAGDDRQAIIEGRIDKYYQTIELDLTILDDRLDLNSWEYYN